MYAPQQSVHQFSPQRRQRIGNAKRTGQQKPLLGEQEASNVGPQKLFSDLKSNAAAKQSTLPTSILKKSPSRALGVKNGQSPQRSQDGQLKPSIGSVKSAVRNIEENAGPIEKGKMKALQDLSPQKSLRQSPNRADALSGLDEGTSYHTISTPFHNAPRTPPANRLGLTSPKERIAFVTPASNIGEAGAVRMRKGEMLDAMNADLEPSQEVQITAEQIPELKEEEMYPEIEYMPPRIDVPYDFPPEFDDLPKARELGERLSKVSLIGFYRPSDEEKRQEMLSEIFKLRPARVEEPEMPPQRAEANDDLWPDIEITVPMKLSSLDTNRKKASLSVQRGATLASNRITKDVKKVASGTSISKLQDGSSKKTIGVKPKALGIRDSNTSIKKKVINPALRDFENDDMGKFIKSKLQAINSQEPEGFLL